MSASEALTVTLVVLGDLERSPRMQYHALALAAKGARVDVVAFPSAPSALLDDPRVTCHLLRGSVSRSDLPRPLFLAHAVARAALVAAHLFRTLLVVPRPRVVLVQNPPAIPTLFVALLAARLRGAKLVVDWHNYGFSMMALKLGRDHLLVRLARRVERALGRRADAHLCVSRAMRGDLERAWGIRPVEVLYDRPADGFVTNRSRDTRVLPREIAAQFGDDTVEALVVSATSWTVDEDFGPLLEAAAICEEAIRRDEQLRDGCLPRILVVVTGRGSLRERFERDVARLGLERFRVLTAWLSAEEYRRLLGTADLGLCFHTSSSGVDLPMKVADMLGAGLPVCAYDYGPCLAERLRDGENALLFKTGEELADRLREAFDRRQNGAPVLERLRAGVARGDSRSWAEGWQEEVWPIFERLLASGGSTTRLLRDLRAQRAEPDISVIVPTRNRSGSVRRTLESLTRQTYPADRFEVIVVANDCSDDTADVVRAFEAPFAVRVREIPTPGISIARNSGAEIALGRLLVFLDDDIEPLETALDSHASAHAGRDDLVAVGPLLAPPIDFAPSLLVERIRALDSGFAAYLHHQESQLDWYCMTGGNMSISRALFLEARGFDVSIASYGGEDYELGCRAEKLGASFALLPEAGAYHHRHENNSFWQYLRRGRSVGRNEVEIVRKHPEVLDRVLLGLVAQPQSRLGRIGRTLAFDRPALGDPTAYALGGACVVLGWVRARKLWNRLVDCLYQYWYYRGVADVVGNGRAVMVYVDTLRRRSSDDTTSDVSNRTPQGGDPVE